MEPQGSSEPLNLSIKKRPVAVVPPSTPEEGTSGAGDTDPGPYLQLLQYMNSARGGEDALSNLIHTNMLTNKIATSNLLTIINKLLEQNIVSEYYFKMQQQQRHQPPDNNNLIDAKMRAGLFGYLRGSTFEETRSVDQKSIGASSSVSGATGGGATATPDGKDANEKKKPHIKKPLNAFMLYMKEMRAKVVAECTLKESAAINQILGRRWHALGRDEQAKYYELARRERQLHMQMYPDWSSRTNSSRGKKRKRKDATDGGNNMKKCRARFGLDQQNQWCKPCSPVLPVLGAGGALVGVSSVGGVAAQPSASSSSSTSSGSSSSGHLLGSGVVQLSGGGAQASPQAPTYVNL